MPCRWEASERPLAVRTVWVRGMRHALLTREELARGGLGLAAREERRPRRSPLGCYRPATPYSGPLWESPRPGELDLKSRPAVLASPRKRSGRPSASEHSPASSTERMPDSPLSSPPPVSLYLSPPASTVQPPSSARPKLHIFIPDSRPRRLDHSAVRFNTSHWPRSSIST